MTGHSEQEPVQMDRTLIRRAIYECDELVSTLKQAEADQKSLRAHITAIEADRERLTKALARARTYVEMSYDENGGEEAAEAKHDLKEIDLALSPPSTSQSEGEG
mgnify:CR=1 FL=1